MSNIIYAPTSWNPISGCSPVSEGCQQCWAKAMARRQRQEWGTVHLHPERLEQPLHWRKPQTVAVAFMGDLFHDQAPDEFIDKVFAVMALTPQHTYLLLTKRPERMRVYLGNSGPQIDTAVLERCDAHQCGKPADSHAHGYRWPLPNVWLGVSCENQARTDERIPLLLEMKGWRKWASLEPLLGAVDLRPYLSCRTCGYTPADRRGNLDHELCKAPTPNLDWIVCGGESGPKARPCDTRWLLDIVAQCKTAGTPCHVKQMGSVWARLSKTPDSKGEDMAFWPADLRVRELSEGVTV